MEAGPRPISARPWSNLRGTTQNVWRIDRLEKAEALIAKLKRTGQKCASEGPLKQTPGWSMGSEGKDWKT